MRRNSIALGRRQQIWLHATTIVVFLSGAIWALLHYYFQHPGEFGPEINSLEPVALKIHGGAAMLILIVLGSLLPLHVHGGWKMGRNVRSGVCLLLFFSLLTITGYGLYYAGSEQLRAWTSKAHLILGLALPLVIFGHIFLGRRSRA